MASRSPERMAETIEELKGQTGKEAISLRLDLADLESVKTAAEEFIRFVNDERRCLLKLKGPLCIARRHSFIRYTTMRGSFIQLSAK